MKVDLTGTVAIIDGHDLGPLLGVPPEEVPQKMREGKITSLSETGVGEDEGQRRLV